jgi:hypothetical protein
VTPSFSPVARAYGRRCAKGTVALGALLLAGCASLGPRPDTAGVYASPPVAQHLRREDDVGLCARLLREADRAIDAAGVRDALAARVPGFPYLRVDRITAALAPAPAPDAGVPFVAWSHLLAQLDAQARRFESANAPTDSTPFAAVDACRLVLARADDTADDTVALRAALRAAATVPDDYSAALRAVGLYPLTRLAFAAGVADWQVQTKAVFAMPLPQLPQQGRLVRYAPTPLPIPVVPRVAQAPHLGLPVRSEASLRSLIARHAPLVDVDTASSADRIGALRWKAGADTAADPAADSAAGSVAGSSANWMANATGNTTAAAPIADAPPDKSLRIAVDPTDPVAYVRLTHTLVAGKPLLQIVYTLWFGARPPASAFDPLAGALDGLIWRVTLDAQGEALVYDSIHPCGCYHLFFATSRVQARPAPRRGADGQPEGRYDESLFLPQVAPVDATARSRVLLRVAAGTHYLQRVLIVPQDAALPDARPLAYGLRDDDELRSLPLPGGGGRRSAFGPDGLIAGSERSERYYFWPMGIDSAGQMRQWGRHATAFVGRRHFDDPTLVDRYFLVIGDR